MRGLFDARMRYEKRRFPQPRLAELADQIEQVVQTFAAGDGDRMQFVPRPRLEQWRGVELRPAAAITLDVFNRGAARGERITEQFAPAVTAENHNAPASDVLHGRQLEQRFAVEA